MNAGFVEASKLGLILSCNETFRVYLGSSALSANASPWDF